MNRVQILTDTIWRYRDEGEWYLCKQNHSEIQNNANEDKTVEVQKRELKLTELLNSL